MRFGEAAQLGRAAFAVQHAAAGDQQRALRRTQQVDCRRHLDRFGHRRAHPDHCRREKGFRKIVGLRLHVLRQREGHRSAAGRVGQHRDRARQRAQQLPGRDDAVEVARHGLEAIVGGNSAVAEILDLLQHRVRRARNEHVARQEEHRQPVDMRGRRGSDQVGRTRADRRGAGHHPPPEMRLGVGNGGVRHCLLVVRTVRRQHSALAVQRLADSRHIAVAEDRPHAAEQRDFLSLPERALRGEKTDQCLRHREPDRVHHCPFCPAPASLAAPSAVAVIAVPAALAALAALSARPPPAPGSRLARSLRHAAIKPW